MTLVPPALPARRALRSRVAAPRVASAFDAPAPDARASAPTRSSPKGAPAGIGAVEYLTCLAGVALLAVASRPWAASPALAWVSFLPVFRLVRVLAARRRFLSAAACGAFTATGVTAVAYEAALGVSVPAYLVAVVAAALPFGAACGMAAFVLARLRGAGRRLAWLVPPVLWCCAELSIRQEWLAGAWAPALAVIGYSQVGTPAAQLARVGSVTAVSLAVLLANALALALLEAIRLAVASVGSGGSSLLGRVRPVLPPVAGLGLLWLVIWWAAAAAPAVAEAQTAPGAGTRIVVVQPNLPSAVRAAAAADAALAAELLAAMAALTGPGGAAVPALAVWPEGVWPGRLSHAPDAADAGSVARPGSYSRTALPGLPPLLLGAASRDESTGTYGNSAFAFTGSDLVHVSDKSRLVPFAEAGMAPGATPGPVELGGVLAAPVICYDVAFPATVRAAARSGAELLAVMTDDTFAAGGDVPLQHLRVARMRAIEVGIWLAFASNGGPSAIVDPAGRLVALSTSGEATALHATARLGPGSTPYLRYGDWVGALTFLLTICLLGAAARKGGGYRLSPST